MSDPMTTQPALAAQPEPLSESVMLRASIHRWGGMGEASLVARLDALDAAVSALRVSPDAALLARAMDMLRHAEWEGNESTCLFCGGRIQFIESPSKWAGHAACCMLAALLRDLTATAAPTDPPQVPKE